LNTRPGFELEVYQHGEHFVLRLAEATGGTADIYLDVESADRLIDAIKEGRDKLERRQLEASCASVREEAAEIAAGGEA
jgi:hypothetical protein